MRFIARARKGPRGLMDLQGIAMIWKDCKDLGGFAWICKDLEGFALFCEGLQAEVYCEGSARAARPYGFARICKDLEGFAWICKNLEGLHRFAGVCKDL